jgi:hypothetical protein
MLFRLFLIASLTNNVFAIAVVRNPKVCVGTVGVPVRAGEIDRTVEPVPVLVVTPVPPFATARVPARVIVPDVLVLGVSPVVPAEKEVTPEPEPEIADWTKAVVASCVVFVPATAVGAVGTPVNAGAIERTTDPVPVLVITPVPPFATARVPASVIAPLVAEAGVKPVVPAEKEDTPVLVIVATPLVVDTDIPVPAVAERRPVLETVATALVVLTPIPVPATTEVIEVLEAGCSKINHWVRSSLDCRTAVSPFVGRVIDVRPLGEIGIVVLNTTGIGIFASYFQELCPLPTVPNATIFEALTFTIALTLLGKTKFPIVLFT